MYYLLQLVLFILVFPPSFLFTPVSTPYNHHILSLLYFVPASLARSGNNLIILKNMDSTKLLIIYCTYYGLDKFLCGTPEYSHCGR